MLVLSRFNVQRQLYRCWNVGYSSQNTDETWRWFRIESAASGQCIVFKLTPHCNLFEFDREYIQPCLVKGDIGKKKMMLRFHRPENIVHCHICPSVFWAIWRKRMMMIQVWIRTMIRRKMLWFKTVEIEVRFVVLDVLVTLVDVPCDCPRFNYRNMAFSELRLPRICLWARDRLRQDRLKSTGASGGNNKTMCLPRPLPPYRAGLTVRDPPGQKVQCHLPTP